MLTTKEIAEEVENNTYGFSIRKTEIGEIHDAGNRELLGLSEEDFTLFVEFEASYEGEPPEEIRVLNAFVSDFVTVNKEKLEKEIEEPLSLFLKKEYGDGDLSDFGQEGGDFIWESQIDFVPLINPDENKIHFNVELLLVLETE